MQPSKLPVYADPNMGNIGYFEKQWFYPLRRQQAFLQHLQQTQWWQSVVIQQSRPASDEELQLFHHAIYVRQTQEQCASDQGHLGDGATLARTHMEKAARHVVGAVLDATKRIVAGEWQRAFVPIAGFHHARADQARMYCLYNDACIALRYALPRLAGNIGYIDTDVHFGDGVYDAFAAEPRVIGADLHEDDRTLFPYSPDNPAPQSRRDTHQLAGEQAATGHKLTLALAPLLQDEDYARYMQQIEDLMAQHTPNMIIFNCGLDVMKGDPLGHQQVSSAGIYALAKRVVALADRYADGKLLVLGGGGYHEPNLGPGWSAVVQALVEEQ